ncbi:hypothetical protein SNEBB_003999 [Seison nebaliae]|nr:hypothetical protein SNEBB_003999 [Seison nebaliae]
MNKKGRGSSGLASKRLMADYCRLKKEPIDLVFAEPLQNDILKWRYVIKGPKNTAYENGIYCGKLEFPSDYPIRPPNIYMTTPNGRFETNKKLCMSISAHHPEQWNPIWSIGTILIGILSFMTDTTPTAGSIETTEGEKKTLAQQSHSFNLRDGTFKKLFPSIAEECRNFELVNNKTTITTTTTTTTISVTNNDLEKDSERSPQKKGNGRRRR